MKSSKKNNSWVLSIENKTNTKYNHHYFCSCLNEFKLKTEINEPYIPDILCPICGNNYFIDVNDFVSKNGTKIWKYFRWENKGYELENSWGISLGYQLPIYYDLIDKVKLENQELLYLELQKDGSKPIDIAYKSKLISRYSLFEDDIVKPFKSLLIDEAKENLCKYILKNKSNSIEWITHDNLTKLSIQDKFKYISFFLKHTQLKEHEFFFWEMEEIIEATQQNTTQVEMLDFIANNRKERSVKKALYTAYDNSINTIGYYAYSDYIFSRTINNTDLLIKLYGIYPAIKEHLFTGWTFSVAIEFILFLKQHYTEKQIVKLFVEDMQDDKEYKTRLNSWRDTLQMIKTKDAFSALNNHFSKVKLTVKKLHDEIVRVFHLVSYELDAKESFEYEGVYLSACTSYENLDFRLPKTVKELSFWSKILHNCMFGYSRKIHEKKSIIYGVFRKEELLYAVEVNDFKIVQAKAVSNNSIPIEDMKIINSWKNNSLIYIQT